jgi:hypothetical protein
VPPAPEHTKEYTVVAVIGAVVCMPPVASGPLQPPEAVHESAPVELQLSDEVLPKATAPGDAVKVAVGKGFTVTSALAGALLPPGPEQVSTKLALPFKVPVLWLPLTGSVPLQAPEAVQEVAWVEVHVSVADCPASTVISDAVREAVGTGVGAPPPPPQADKRSIGPMIRRLYKKRTPSQILFSRV